MVEFLEEDRWMDHIHVLERYFEVVRLAIAKPNYLGFSWLDLV